MAELYDKELPGELVKHVTALCGDRGREWLLKLPETIAELEEIWGVEVGEPFVKGEFNFVAPASSETGMDAIIKVSPPYETIEIFAEARFLTIRQGIGCVNVFAENQDRFAMIIERARPGVSMDLHFQYDPFACVEPAIEVLKDILLPPSAARRDVQFLDDWFTNFRRFRETDFPRGYGERALAIQERLSSDAANIFYLHGDFHPGNIVSSNRSPFLAIDPKGLVGHIGYDIAVFLNNLHWWQKGTVGVEIGLTNALRKFADAFSLKESDVREMAYAYMVIGAWWNFDEMPEHYNNEVALADVWDV